MPRLEVPDGALYVLLVEGESLQTNAPKWAAWKMAGAIRKLVQPGIFAERDAEYGQRQSGPGPEEGF